MGNAQILHAFAAKILRRLRNQTQPQCPTHYLSTAKLRACVSL